MSAANSATHIHQAFVHETDVHKFIDDVQLKSDGALEADFEKLTVIMDGYQEQPHLLDPFLERIMGKLISKIQDKETSTLHLNQYSKYLCLVTKVRGYKRSLRYFSHEVADLEKILSLLTKQNPSNHTSWETRYVLLLWLAIVSIIPFDLAKLDGSTPDTTVTQRIYQTALPYLSSTGKCKDAAAYLLAKFLTRPDVQKEKLPEFFTYSCGVMSRVKDVILDNKVMDGNELLKLHANHISVLTTLALIFKYGKRDDLIGHATNVFQAVESGEIVNKSDPLIRKLTMKLVQRIGLVYLPPKLLAWRYQRGSRSLAENLKPKQNDAENTTDNRPEEAEDTENEDFDIPEELESIIELLITGLKDKDTIVRWCSAKGIGRITGRLPKELADEVVESLFELFTFEELDSAWHGGCLTFAELGRRGLLLPERLTEVVPIILKALLYDERRGSYSVGAHVRDAACYVCWSFARAYDPQQIQKHVNQIAAALLTVTVFDREVNCRRAASAAFQENVGRQGVFPHGIDIVVAADYFAVGSRSNCYNNLSVYLASFPEYTTTLIDHLVKVKVSHWDSDIRVLTSEALNNLTPCAPEHMQYTVVPLLLKEIDSIDTCTKHGAIHALAEVIHALYTHSKVTLDDESLKKIFQLVPKLRNAKKFKGIDGEMLRKAVCNLIEKIAQCNVQVDDKTVLENWMFVMEDSLSHTVLSVQEAACRSLTSFAIVYLMHNAEIFFKEVLSRFCNQCHSANKFTRMGYTLALGELPRFMLLGNLSLVVRTLIEVSGTTENKLNNGMFAEARMNAVYSIVSCCLTVGLEHIVSLDGSGEVSGSLDRIFDCFFSALKDYTTDSRGDVGAWVREAAMKSLVTYAHQVIKYDETRLTQKISESIVLNLVQQCAEKIDRTRACAGEWLVQYIYHSHKGVYLPDREKLLGYLPKSVCDSLNWAAPAEAYRTIAPLLHLSAYQYHVLLGLCVSVGGLTESLVRSSSDGLLEYFADIQENVEAMKEISDKILHILNDYHKNDRVVIPMMRMLDLLLTSAIWDSCNCGDFPLQLYTVLLNETKNCSDTSKLLASVKIYCGLLQFTGEVRTKSLQRLSILLCHKYPRIRVFTAEQLYTSLLTFDDVLHDSKTEHVQTILTETSWHGEITNLRTIRNQICEFTDIPIPKLKKAASTPTVGTNYDQTGSYKDLVTRSGR